VLAEDGLLRDGKRRLQQGAVSDSLAAVLSSELLGVDGEGLRQVQTADRGHR